jgi:hypothetical protein
MTGPPTPPSGLRCTNLPSRPWEGTRTLWQIIYRSACHHQLGPSSWDSRPGRFVHGQICAAILSTTSVPPASDQESTGTSLVSCRRRENPFRNSFSASWTRGTSSRRSMTNPFVMFFKKGLRDPSLIQKLAVKNPRTSEEMLAITN